MAAGIADRVAFVGEIPSASVHRLLSLADAMVLPSRGEGMPVILMEELSAGSLVCVSAVGGMGEVVRHRENGLVFPELTAMSVASTLAQAQDCLSHEDIRRAARETWRADFDSQATSRTLADVWRSVAG